LENASIDTSFGLWKFSPQAESNNGMNKCAKCEYWIVEGDLKRCAVCGERKPELILPNTYRKPTEPMNKKPEPTYNEVRLFTDSKLDPLNPSKRYNTKKLWWWSCPRCLGQDLYVGTRSQELYRPGFLALESDDSGEGSAIGLSRPRSVNIDVWICRKCGELATKWERPLTEVEIRESKRQGKEEFKQMWDETSTGDKAINILFIMSMVGAGLTFLVIWLFF